MDPGDPEAKGTKAKKQKESDLIWPLQRLRKGRSPYVCAMRANTGRVGDRANMEERRF